jgi:hypothetical protein
VFEGQVAVVAQADQVAQDARIEAAPGPLVGVVRLLHRTEERQRDPVPTVRLPIHPHERARGIEAGARPVDLGEAAEGIPHRPVVVDGAGDAPIYLHLRRHGTDASQKGRGRGPAHTARDAPVVVVTGGGGTVVGGGGGGAGWVVGVDTGGGTGVGAAAGPDPGAGAGADEAGAGAAGAPAAEGGATRTGDAGAGAPIEPWADAPAALGAVVAEVDAAECNASIWLIVAAIER